MQHVIMDVCQPHADGVFPARPPERTEDQMAQDRYPARMSDYDALLWTIEDDPRFRSTVVSVMLLDGVPDRARLLDTAARLTRAVPRFRQCVVPDPLNLSAPRWERDPHFDLAYHVRWTKAPAGGSLDDVLALAAPMAMQGFDKARPLWEWMLVEGLDGDRAALVTKTHHTITDGMGGVEMAMQLFDTERDPAPRDVPDPEEDDATNWIGGAGLELRRVAGLPAQAAKLGAVGIGAFARHPEASVRKLGEVVGAMRKAVAGGAPMSDVMTKRSLSFRFGTLDYSLTEFRAAAKACEGKVNDIFVAGIASGMRTYHAKHGGSATSLRITVIVNTRTESSDPGGNDFTPVRVEIPLVEADIAQVQRIRELVVAETSSPVVPLAKSLTSVARRLPRGLVPPLLGPVQTSVDVLSSNVPGWPMAVYLAGAHVERVIPLATTVGSAINITVMSHEGTMNIGVTSDLAAVPDPEVLLDCFRQGFDQVLSLGA